MPVSSLWRLPRVLFALAVAATVLASLTLLATPALAATPASGFVSSSNSSITWCGGSGCSAQRTGVSTAQTGGSDCTNSTCDVYTLTVGAVSPGYTATVSIRWTNPANDFDLYVYDSSGNLVGSSTGSAPSNSETTTFPAVSGTYTVKALEFTVAADNYVGTASLAPAPQSATPTYVIGGITFSPNVTVKAPVAQRDGEPSNRTDYMGNAYVGGIRGFPAGVDLWWFDLNPSSPTFDPNLRRPSYRGQPDAFPASELLDLGGDGGGDIDLAVGFEPPSVTTTGLPNLTAVSLIAANISSSRSQDLGQTFLKDPGASYIPADDRQWIEYYKGDDVFLFYRAPIPATQLWVATSTDGGLTFPITSLVSTGGTTPGYISIDQQTGWVYVAHLNSTAMFVSRALFDPANPQVPLSFSTATVDNTTSHEHLFDSVKVGHDGTVYALWSDEHIVWYSFSKDHGATWSAKGAVSNPNFVTNDRFGNPQTVKTQIMPWMEAGSAGRVDFVWYGTTDATNDDNADWNVFFAQATNANTGSPVIRQVKASDHFIHAGNVSEMGLGGAANRNILDYFQVSLDPQGGAFIGYADDHNDFLGHTYVTHQISGPSAYAAANGNGTVKTVAPAAIPAQNPNAPQVVDFRDDVSLETATVPSDNAWDIVSIRYGCQATVDGSTLATASMGVSSMSVLPTDTNWRINFSANTIAGLADRGDQFFLQASTGTTTPTFTWGTAVRNSDGSFTYTTRGSTDVGFFDTATSSVVMKVNLNQLNQFASKPIGLGSTLIGLRGSTWTISESVGGVPVLGSAGATVPRDITRGGFIPLGSALQGDVTGGIGVASYTIGSCAGAAVQPPPPPPPGTQQVTSESGDGKIPVNGNDGKFHFDADNSPNGSLTYDDKAGNVSLISSSIDFFEPPAGDACVTFGGHGRLNGAAGHIFTVKACDNGTSGATDTFTITIDSNYSATGTLKSGNINIHEK